MEELCLRADTRSQSTRSTRMQWRDSYRRRRRHPHHHVPLQLHQSALLKFISSKALAPLEQQQQPLPAFYRLFLLNRVMYQPGVKSPKTINLVSRLSYLNVVRQSEEFKKILSVFHQRQPSYRRTLSLPRVENPAGVTHCLLLFDSVLIYRRISFGFLCMTRKTMICIRHWSLTSLLFNLIIWWVLRCLRCCLYFCWI